MHKTHAVQLRSWSNLSIFLPIRFILVVFCPFVGKKCYGEGWGRVASKNTDYISTQDVAFNAHVSKKHYTEDTALPN